MRITTNDWEKHTQPRTRITFEKIEKRWYLVFKGRDTKEIIRVAVRDVQSVTTSPRRKHMTMNSVNE